MKSFKRQTIVAAAVVMLAPYAVAAQRQHREPWPQIDRAPGWEIRALTRQAENEPGVTSELSPGAKQTATGGPSGGVPGFSGH